MQFHGKQDIEVYKGRSMGNYYLTVFRCCSISMKDIVSHTSHNICILFKLVCTFFSKGAYLECISRLSVTWEIFIMMDMLYLWTVDNVFYLTGRSAHRSTQVYLGLDVGSGEIVTITEWDMHCAAIASAHGEMVHSAFSSANFNHQVLSDLSDIMPLSINLMTALFSSHYYSIAYCIQTHALINLVLCL